MAFLLMKTQNGFGREKRVAQSAHEAKLEADVDGFGARLMLRYEMELDQIAVAVTLKVTEYERGIVSRNASTIANQEYERGI